LKTLDVKVTAVQQSNSGLHEQRAEQYHDLREMQEKVLREVSSLSHSSSASVSQVLPSVDGIREMLEALEAKVSNFVAEQKILSSIDYEKRSSRQEAIHKAHTATFHWFSDQPANDSVHKDIIRLQEWLSEKEGIFWMSGRPGSGKSTLMKFIAKHERTDELLNSWAAGFGVTVTKACHFFWNAGTEMQRSHQGLLQSLVYDVLCQNPRLIQHVCDGRWNLAKHEKSSCQPAWTIAELQSTIESIRLHCSASNSSDKLKLCFLVDGLDEFSGDYGELCESLVGLSKCPGIKLLLSSRSWPIFEETLGHEAYGKLYLHDVNEKDIHDYVKMQLEAHPRWRKVVHETAENGLRDGTDLIGEITRRARGVFLWVFLVIRELKEGLTNCDDIRTLQLRLDRIPSDLEQFFRRILDSVDSIYFDSMARWLIIALAARRPLPLLIYALNDMESRDVLEQSEDVSMTSLWPVLAAMETWSWTQWQDIMAPMARKLNARCKGLLEIHEGTIEFLHRTVRAFLSTAPMQSYLASKLKATFDPHIAAIQARLIWIKRTDRQTRELWRVEHSQSRVDSSRYTASELELLGWTSSEFPSALSFLAEGWSIQAHELLESAESVRNYRKTAIFDFLDGLRMFLHAEAAKDFSESGSELLKVQAEPLLCFWRELFWHDHMEYATLLWNLGETPPIALDTTPMAAFEQMHPFDIFLETTVSVHLGNPIEHDFSITKQHVLFLRHFFRKETIRRTIAAVDLGRLQYNQPAWGPLITDAFTRPGRFRRMLQSGAFELFLDHGGDVDLHVPVPNHQFENAKTQIGDAGYQAEHLKNAHGKVELKIWLAFLSQLLRPEQFSDCASAWILCLDRMLKSACLDPDHSNHSQNSQRRFLYTNLSGHSWWSDSRLSDQEAYAEWQMALIYLLYRLQVRKRHSTTEVLEQQADGLHRLIRHGRLQSNKAYRMDMIAVARLVRSVFPGHLEEELIEALTSDQPKAPLLDEDVVGPYSTDHGILQGIFKPRFPSPTINNRSLAGINSGLVLLHRNLEIVAHELYHIWIELFGWVPFMIMMPLWPYLLLGKAVLPGFDYSGNYGDIFRLFWNRMKFGLSRWRST
jgi:hypothetical protein